MLKSKKFITQVVILTLITLLSLSVFVFAEPTDEVLQNSTLDESTGVPTTQDLTKNEDVYLFDSDVTVNYPINGNLFVMGNNIKINSSIDGNVFALGQDIDFEEQSNINGDIFALGSKISIDGFARDLYIMGQSLSINGSIARDIHAGCDILNLYGSIGRNASLNVNNIKFGNSSSIEGNLYYSADNEISIPDGTVKGSTTFDKIEVNTEEVEEAVNTKTVSSIITEKIGSLVKTLIFALIIILILTFAMKNFNNKALDILKYKTGATFGYGALALFLTPLISILLLFTIIGIMAGITLAVVYIFLLTIATAIVSTVLARLICQKINKDTKLFNILIALGFVLAIWIIKFIPLIGFLASITINMVALGIITYSIFNKKEITKPEDNK